MLDSYISSVLKALPADKDVNRYSVGYLSPLEAWFTVYLQNGGIFGGLVYCSLKVSTNSYSFLVTFEHRNNWRSSISYFNWFQNTLFH